MTCSPKLERLVNNLIKKQKQNKQTQTEITSREKQEVGWEGTVYFHFTISLEKS